MTTVVVANKPRPRTNRNRSNRAPATMSMAGVISVQHPRPFFNFTQAGAEKVSVHGHEMLSTMYCSVDVDREGPFLLNPAIANVFPRLSSLALSFEKFRFKRLRLVYNSAAPTTRSGQIAMCIVSDPEAQAPSDVVQLYSYQCSAVTPVGMSAMTPWFRPAEPGKWFLTNAITSPDTNVDPTNRFIGKMFVLSTRCVSADAHAIAGEVSIEYECEFTNTRPALTISTSCTEPSAITYTDAETRPFWDDIISQIGWWGHEAGNDGPINDASALDQNSTWLVPAGRWIVNYLFDFEDATSSYTRVGSGSQPKTPVVRHRYLAKSAPGRPYVLRRPSILYAPFDDDSKDMPEAAGDITVRVKAKPSDGGAIETLSETVYAAGTSALTAEEAVPFVLPIDARLFFAITLATGEERVVAAGNALMSLNVISTNVFSTL